MVKHRIAAFAIATVLWAECVPSASAVRDMQLHIPKNQMSAAALAANAAMLGTANRLPKHVVEPESSNVSKKDQQQLAAAHLNTKTKAQAALTSSLKSLSILADKNENPSASVAEGLEAGSSPPTDSISQAECIHRPLQGAKHNKVHLPNFFIEFELRSPRPRQLLDITIVSQLSMNRLEMLGHQCSAWGGVISAAVYQPLLSENSEEEHAATIAAARKQLKEFHATIESAGGCRLDLVLATELVREAMLFAYPYNALRNTALLRATTEVVLLLDVDFVVNAGLHERLLGSAEALSKDTSQYRHAIVLPAFETDPGLSKEEGALVASAAVTGTKKDLEIMFRSRQVVQFAEFYPPGHAPTKYNTWFKASSPYPVRFKMGYEPYVLVSRAMVPLYDERFRGYGFDKVMHIWQMHIQGFHFLTHPSAFVVHCPHAPSAGYKAAFTGPAYTTKHRSTRHMASMKKLSEDMIREVKAQTYPAGGVSAVAQCRPVPKQQPRLDAWW